ncbi:MAG: FAD-dependent oxidoreductase [Lachnospiraceae bacterium]|nr:FAD-dependent oxidoreductase [Lachnospiraceae bacterium]MBQ3972912.1 FAD-dependent oxidoreductase [Lachnospiraceae bacterium]
MAWLIDTLESEMEEAGVRVKTGVCADPAMIRETEPEAVFLCTGARAICPDLPGIGSEKVVTAAQVLTEEKKVCGKVLVAGAGLTGLETAEKIFRLGDAESVTVIDMVPQIGAGMYPSIYIDVVHQMEGKPLTLLASRKLKEVTETGIIAENLAEGKDEEIPADFVVLALGNRTDREMIRTWEEAFDRVVCLGQTHKNPGRIATSLTEAYIAARGFDPMA